MQSRAAAELALVISLVEMLEQPHAGDGVERGAAGQHQLVAAGYADQMVDDVDQRILEHHLGGGGLVEPFLGVLLVADVLDAEHRVGIPHVLERNRLAQDADQILGVRLGKIARPIRQVAIDVNLAVGRQLQDRAQRRIKRIGLAVVIAPGRGAHVAALAGEQRPAALGRRDDGIEDAERVGDMLSLQ